MVQSWWKFEQMIGSRNQISINKVTNERWQYSKQTGGWRHIVKSNQSEGPVESADNNMWFKTQNNASTRSTAQGRQFPKQERGEEQFNGLKFKFFFLFLFFHGLHKMDVVFPFNHIHFAAWKRCTSWTTREPQMEVGNWWFWAQVTWRSGPTSKDEVGAVQRILHIFISQVEHFGVQVTHWQKINTDELESGHFHLWHFLMRDAFLRRKYANAPKNDSLRSLDDAGLCLMALAKQRPNSAGDLKDTDRNQNHSGHPQKLQVLLRVSFYFLQNYLFIHSSFVSTSFLKFKIRKYIEYLMISALFSFSKPTVPVAQALQYGRRSTDAEDVDAAKLLPRRPRHVLLGGRRSQWADFLMTQ